MSNESRGTEPAPSILAADLDGTLIPLEGNEANRAALARIAESVATRQITLVYVTGRHVASVRRAITEHALPRPHWIICDVGSTMYEQRSDGTFAEEGAYRERLESICSARLLIELRDEFLEISALQLQEEEKQGRFKLSYYIARSELRAAVTQIEERLEHIGAPCSLISSIDPFTGDGLIDVLPRDISKAYALQWWSEHHSFERTEIVFAGDSGNDLAALVAGYRTILVGNADPDLARQVAEEHHRQRWTDRLFLAADVATSGVLSGCQQFGLFPPPESNHAAPSRDG